MSGNQIRRIAQRLAKRVVTTGHLSGASIKQLRLRRSQQFVTVLSRADGIHVHFVFANSRRESVEKEARTLRNLLADFAEEVMVSLL